MRTLDLGDQRLSAATHKTPERCLLDLPHHMWPYRRWQESCQSQSKALSNHPAVMGFKK